MRPSDKYLITYAWFSNRNRFDFQYMMHNVRWKFCFWDWDVPLAIKFDFVKKLCHNSLIIRFDNYWIFSSFLQNCRSTLSWRNKNFWQFLVCRRWQPLLIQLHVYGFVQLLSNSIELTWSSKLKFKAIFVIRYTSVIQLALERHSLD